MQFNVIEALNIFKKFWPKYKLVWAFALWCIRSDFTVILMKLPDYISLQNTTKSIIWNAYIFFLIITTSGACGPATQSNYDERFRTKTRYGIFLFHYLLKHSFLSCLLMTTMTLTTTHLNLVHLFNRVLRTICLLCR